MLGECRTDFSRPVIVPAVLRFQIMVRLQVVVVILVVCSATAVGDEDGVAYFEEHIEPVLMDHCYRCHSDESEEPAGGLLLNTREGIREGGETGPAVVPNDLEESLLISAIHYEDLEMPPEEMLDEETIRHFENWIQMGAPDPRGDRPPEPTSEVSKAIRNPELPKVRDGSWPRIPLDRFVLAQLEANGLTPAAEASVEELYVRMSRTLNGRSPAEIGAAVDAGSLEEQMDVWLASDGYAALKAADWVDEVRAAGRADANEQVSPAYLRYVTQALKGDAAYDQFVRHQLAADLLPEKSRRNSDGALLFLDRGLKDAPEDLVDRLLLSGKVFAGRNLLCGQCHDSPPAASLSRILAGLKTTSNSASQQTEADTCSGMPQGFPALNHQDTRLRLAEWIVSPANSSSARIAADRIWRGLFGRGLLTQLNQAGPTSEPSSHPELLDWLSWRLVHKHKWSQRALTREILLSRTWRQSAEVSSAAKEKDPDNSLYGRATWPDTLTDSR